MKTAGTGPRLAARARSLEVSPTVAMAAKARALKAKGVRVFDFTVGEPDQPTPRHVLDAGKAAIDAGRTKYAPASGLPELRAAVAQRYREDFDVAFAPGGGHGRGGRQAGARPRSTRPSSTAAARSSSRSRPGRRSPRPRAWPAARPSSSRSTRRTASASRRARWPRDHAEDARRRRQQPLEPDRGRRSSPTSSLKIARLAKKHGFWLLYDDTYAHLVFRPAGPPALQEVEGRGRRAPRGGGDGVEDLLHDRLAGRLGDGAEGARRAPAPRSTPTPCRGRRRSPRSPRRRRSPGRRTRCASMAAEYRRRRDLIHPVIAAIPGVTCPQPEGGFYVFPDVSRCLSKELPDTLALGGEAARGEGGGGRARRGLPRPRLLPALLRDRLRGPAGGRAAHRRVPRGARAPGRSDGERAGASRPGRRSSSTSTRPARRSSAC